MDNSTEAKGMEQGLPSWMGKRNGGSSKVCKRCSHVSKTHIDSDSGVCFLLVMKTFMKYLSHWKPFGNKEKRFAVDRCR